MPLRVPQCPLCSDACELKTLPAICGEDGTLKLTLRDLPMFQCPKNHKTPVHRDFMIWLIREIRTREAQIAAAREQIRSAKELHGHVPAAMVAINDAAGFPHSG